MNKTQRQPEKQEEQAPQPEKKRKIAPVVATRTTTGRKRTKRSNTTKTTTKTTKTTNSSRKTNTDTAPRTSKRRKPSLKSQSSTDPSGDSTKREASIKTSIEMSKKDIYRHVIDGWPDTHTNADAEMDQNGDQIHPVINPATNKPSLYYQETSQEALEHAIQQANAIQEHPFRGQKPSSSSSIVDDASWWSDPHQYHRRANVLAKIAELLGKNTDRLADLEVHQIGRPRKEMRFQLSRLPEWFVYYASLLRVHGCGFGDGGPPFGGGGEHVNLVRRIPLGVVAQITPFNHPLLIAVKKIAPALAAGNCVVLKPSEQAPASIVELAGICQQAGLPGGVLSVVLGGTKVGQALVGDPRVRRVDFTGGPSAGSAIGAAAGKNVCGMTQELGGKAPMIVFSPKTIGDGNNDEASAEAMDRYLDPIVNGCAFGAFIASGQTCIAGTRLLVQREIYSKVCEKLARKIETVILGEGMGDPFEMTTTFGPMINAKQLEFVHSIVTSCTAGPNGEGENGPLELLCGGKRYRGFEGDESHLNEGNWYEPTLLALRSDAADGDDWKTTATEVHRTSPLFQTELFGPVLGILPFDDEEHAIELANDSPFSLGCSIWTHDLVQAHSVADKVRAGIVWVNDHHKNAPASPWGGLTKGSGIGRENGLEALLDYSQAKSLVVRTTPFDADWFRDPNARYN